MTSSAPSARVKEIPSRGCTRTDERHHVCATQFSGAGDEADRSPREGYVTRVDVEPGRTLLDVIAFEQDLQELLGRRVDVLTEGGLSPYLQERILAEAASL